MSLEHPPARGDGSSVVSASERGGLLDDWLTDKELAHELHRNERTLQRWRRLGEAPPSIMMGGERRTHREAAAKWLRSLLPACEGA